MLRFIRCQINRVLFRVKNKHNNIHIKKYYPVEKIIIGKESYGILDIKSYNTNGTIKIGNYCSIADNNLFLIGGEHNYKRISTFPFQTNTYKQKTSNKINYDITIEDDVWIGYGCLIMSGAHIGKGSVIGARSVVSGNIPPYSIYVGNKVIKQRFSDTIIDRLRNIDFSKIDHSIDDDYSRYCQEEITEDNIDDIIKSFMQ